MTSKCTAQTNQQQKSDKSQTSGILQRAAVRSVSDTQVQSTENKEAQPFSNSAFSKDFSRVPISTTKPQQIMAKLTIGAVGDKYEQEADRVAAQVVQRINTPASVHSGEDETVQREEMETKDNEARLMRSPILQRSSSNGGMAATPDLETSINRARGGGRPIENNVRKQMEQGFGADFSGVKIHTDAQSDQLNQSIQARAFTTGQNVFFRQGEYNPGSRGGQELLAHELTHVVQQSGRAVQMSLNSKKKVTIIGDILQRNPNDKKRKREEGEGNEHVEDNLMSWLKDQPREDKSFFDEKKVHQIIKDDKDLACWNWALRGLSDEGGPSPENFWNYIIVDKKDEENLPNWMNNITEQVQKQIKELTVKISEAKLSRENEFTVPNKISGKKQQGKAKELLTEACSLIVQAHGLLIASEGEEAGWVVCQYVLTEGVAVPEHWWIELPGGVVMQTVPGQNLEIGGEETKYHTEGGRLEKDAKKYNEIRIPVKSLKGNHINILKRGMEDAKKKKQRIDNSSAQE